MEAINQTLLNLGKTLGQKIGDILETACSIEQACGESKAWSELLNQYKITPVTIENKTIELQKFKATHGAAVDEVFRVCEKIIQKSKNCLDELNHEFKSKSALQEKQIQFAIQIASDAGDENALNKANADSEKLDQQIDKIDSGYTNINNLIDPLLEKTIKKYKATVIPKKAMFGNIKKRAKDKKENAASKQKSGFVLKCNSCGAPRLNEADFICSFCGNKFGN